MNLKSGSTQRSPFNIPATSNWSRNTTTRSIRFNGTTTLVRDPRLGVRRVGRVLLDAADEIERGVERLVVLRIRRDVGLRAGLLVAFRLEVAAQRSLAARVGACLEFLGHL